MILQYLHSSPSTGVGIDVLSLKIDIDFPGVRCATLIARLR